MGKLFRKSLFGGFHKKDVIAYIESSAAKQKEELRFCETELQQMQAMEEELRMQLQMAESDAAMLKTQLMQAQEHNAALRREADSAENRGAEARIRAQALEQELAAVKAECEELRSNLSKLQEAEAALEAQCVRNQALETRCATLQNELDARQRRLEELQDALAFQQSENERLQGNYTALLQKQAENPVMTARQSCAAQPAQEDLLYLRREMQRMRDSYDALVLSVLGNGRHPEGDAQCRQDLLVTINRQMDQALDYLEKLVNLRAEEPAQPVKVQPVRKDPEKKSAALEEILRMVRGNR